MDKIWIKCIYHTLGMNNDVSNHIINSDDRWNDVHCNHDYNIYTQPNYYIIHYSFDIINNPQKKGHIVRWNNVISNLFISDEHKEKLWNIYVESRKKYNVLSRFVNRCKYKSISVKVSHDLNMEEIKLNPYTSTTIFQDGALYYFTISDLIKICESSLGFCDEFFSEAYLPKNPYTNKEFSYPILYRIYKAIRFSNYKIPFLMEMFYRSNFDIELFKFSNDVFIREHCIKSFVKNGSCDEHYQYIQEMLEMQCFDELFDFNCDFPESVIVYALKPYMFMYIIYRYSLRTAERKNDYRILLKRSLIEFKQANPTFGRNLTKLERIFDYDIKKWVKQTKSVMITDFIETNVKLPKFNELVPDIIIKTGNVFGNILNYLNSDCDY